MPVETIAKAKERGITASQFVEEAFLKFIAEEEAKENLKKVS